jgi:protein TonB
MFDNLVESSSHKDDLARKGSFIGATVIIYAVVLTALGIGSIFWYDAQLENQNLELVTLVAPVPIEEKQKEPPKEAPKQTQASQEREVSTVTKFVTERPEVAPTEIKTKTVGPPPDVQGARIGTENRVVIGGPPVVGTGTGPATGGGGAPVVDEPPPPPPKAAPTPAPVPKAPISGGVLNGKAISLPKPAYPAVAKAARQTGTVTVQVTIDENGSVISARAVSGPPLLQAAAVQAAYGARFSPTKLSGQPVKVTGVITYNFQL